MRGLNRLREQDTTFYFNVGEKSHACPESVARLVSERAFRNSLCDGTIDCFDVPVRDNDVFSLFLRDLEVPVDWTVQSVDRVAVATLAQAIGNEGLLRRVCDVEYPKSDLSAGSVLDRLEVKRRKGLPFEDEVEFLARNFLEVARHFHESGICLLEHLGVEVCERVLEHPEFEVSDDGELLRMITAAGEEFHPLLRFLRFDRLTGSDARELAAQFSDDGPGALWFAVSRRLECELEGVCEVSVTPEVPAQEGTEFVYDEARPLDGIIAHLTRECSGNVHQKGVVKVTASSSHSFMGAKPENVVDLGTDSILYSKDRPNSWICYDFRGRRVVPTSYSIRSAEHQLGPKSWVLEVSNAGSEDSWVVVDARQNNEDLNARRVTRNFAISAPPSEAFRFVRLRQTGRNHDGDDTLVITTLELFGALSNE